MQTMEILLLLPFSMLFCSIVFSDSAFFLVAFFPEVFLTTEHPTDKTIHRKSPASNRELADNFFFFLNSGFINTFLLPL